MKKLFLVFLLVFVVVTLSYVQALDTIPGVVVDPDTAVVLDRVFSVDSVDVEKGQTDKITPKSVLKWVWENILLLIMLLEVIVRLTPTEKDNSVLRWIQSLLDAVIPNLRRGGGRFAAFDKKKDAPRLRVVRPKSS